MPIIVSGTSGKTVISGSGQAFAEGASQLPSSNKGTGDVIFIGNNDGNLVAGMIYVLSGVHNTAIATWATASAASTVHSTGLLGVALGTDTGGGFLIRGLVKSTYLTGRVGGTGSAKTGSAVYLSASAGHGTNTAPSSTNQVVRVLGYAVDSANTTIFFNPDPTWVVVA